VKAAVFIRYRSGDGAGHVGWAYALDARRAHAGSVENHSGHIFTPATGMGFWDTVDPDPAPKIRAHEYDDVKYVDVAAPDPIAAYRTVLWIKHQAYFAIHRNCEDDAYDVLRSYGVKNLPPPLWHWFPRGWFRALGGTTTPVSDFDWGGAGGHAAFASGGVDLGALTPRRPTWRRPWHLHFHLLKLSKLLRTAQHLNLWRKHRS
jgi:hypothetical protein